LLDVYVFSSTLYLTTAHLELFLLPDTAVLISTIVPITVAVFPCIRMRLMPSKRVKTIHAKAIIYKNITSFFILFIT
jgi:hypothetical protein